MPYSELSPQVRKEFLSKTIHYSEVGYGIIPEEVNDLIRAIRIGDLSILKVSNFWWQHCVIQNRTVSMVLVNITEDTDPRIALHLFQVLTKSNVALWRFLSAVFAVIENNPETDIPEDVLDAFADSAYDKEILKKIGEFNKNQIIAFMSHICKVSSYTNHDVVLVSSIVTAIFRNKIFSQRELALMIAACLGDGLDFETSE